MTANVFASDYVLTPSELETARCYVERTTMAAREAVEGLSETQMNFKPAADRWSIAENLEHMAVVQEVVLGPVREQLAQAAVVVPGDPRPLDSLVLKLFPERTRRFPGPERVHPKGQSSPAESLGRMSRNCARLIEWLETTPDLRQHQIEARPLKALTDGAHVYMDGYQWILGAAGHTERHIRQIEEIKADADFPAE
jgi:hypothetical protein